MRMLKSIVIAVLFISANFGAALAQTANIEGMPIQVGDTLDKVQDFYKTTMVPEPVKTFTGEVTGLQLKTKGVWFFFDKDGKIDTIRLDAPFKGAVNGVRIGDSTVKMRGVLGEPIKTLKRPFSSQSSGHIYIVDDRTTARFDVDDDNKIETVFLFK
jgi:hypothetical protein